jgi:hypothetical protein
MKYRPFAHGITVLITSAAAYFVLGCASTTPQSKENLLITAGFKTYPADTPAKQNLLKSMPAGRISTIQRQGHTYYVYPHLAANSALVGTQKEYTTYQQLRDLKQISNRNLEESESAPLPAAGWGAWGGWGGGFGW